MFPSSGPAVVTALWPVQLTTPAVLGGVLAVSAQFTPANVGFYIIDGAGTAVDAGTCDALPTGVALTGTTAKHAVFTFDSSYLSGKTQGAFALELSATDCLPQLAAFQWGGFADLLAQAATFINDNINGNVGRIQQAVMGNTTWDHTTGTVGMFDGESFVLADEAGDPVTDQSLAVRRINSTV